MNAACPQCGGTVSPIDSERFRCEGCGATMQRRKRPAASPTVASSTASSSSASALDAGATGTAPVKERRSGIIKIASAAAAVVAVAGITWVVLRPASPPPPAQRPVETDVAQKPPDAPTDESSAESSAERRRRRAERLRAQTASADASTDTAPPAGVKVFEEPRPAPETPGKQPDPPAKGASTPTSSASAFTRAAWAIAAAPEHNPLIDGVPARPRDGAWASGSWTLVVPAGRHVVQMDAGKPPEMVESQGGFVEFYKASAARFRNGEAYDFEKLIQATRTNSGVFHEPLLPHHWGNYFWQAKDSDAAVRMWKEAVQVDPAFAPSHLNLSHAYAESGDHDAARRAAQLAGFLNVQDAFGLSGHLEQLRLRLQIPAFDDDSARYVASHDEQSSSLTVEQERGLRVLATIADLCIDPIERIRATSNIGIYLRHEQQPRVGLKYFRRALGEALSMDQHPEAADLRRRLLENIERGMQDVGMGEHIIYARLKDAP